MLQLGYQITAVFSTTLFFLVASDGAEQIRGLRSRNTQDSSTSLPVSIVSTKTGESLFRLLPNTLDIIPFDGDVGLLNLVLDTDLELESVRFKLTNQSSGESIHKREGRAPFALCGNTKDSFIPCDEGILQHSTDYTLEVLLGGAESSWETYMFRIGARATPSDSPSPTAQPSSPPPPLSTTWPSSPPPTPSPPVSPRSSSGKLARFQLIDANTNEVLETDLLDGTVLTAAEGDAWNIEVIPLHDDVVFTKFSTGHKEGRRPYSLCGDKAGQFEACPDLHETGDHSFAVTLIAAGNVRLARVYLDIKTVGVELQNPPTAITEGVPTGAWKTLDGDAPITARHEACFVWVQGKAYLIGGRRKPPTDVYDPATNKWATMEALPPIALHHMQCAVIGEEVWIVSAWTGSYPREKTPDKMYIYDTVTDTWSTKPAMPEERRRGSSAVVYDRTRNLIYVSHGNVGGHAIYNHATPFATGWLDIYDIATEEWTMGPSAPNPRDHTGAALLEDGKYLCVAGGRDSGRFGWPAVRDTDCFDLESRTWSVEAPIPVSRAGSSYGASCDGKFLLVAGGELGNSVFSQFSAFDGKSWISLSNLRVARHGSGLAVDCTGGNIYIASGSGGPRGGPELTSIEVLNM